MFIYNMIKADRNDEAAKKMNIKTYNREEEAKREFREWKEKAEKSMERVKNRKAGILASSIKNFLDLYEKIIKIDFVENEGIKELYNIGRELEAYKINKTYKVIAPRTVETGAEILGTMITKGGLVSGAILKDSELNLDAARMRKKRANVEIENMATGIVILKGIYDRNILVTDTLTKLNLLFIKSIKTTKEIIEKNGVNHKNYSSKDREKIMLCMNLAKAVKDILNSKIIDENDEVNKASIEAIENGQKYINLINDNLK